MDKKREKEILKIIEKAGDTDNYETSYDEHGVPKGIKSKKKISTGKKSRAQGASFELRVRKDMESKGRIVDKWTNNVDLEAGKIVGAKRKFNPYSRIMSIGTGFPDFISIKNISGDNYSVIGVEVKINGTLSKEEKEKCAWYLQNKIFSEIWVAYKEKEGNRVEVKYYDFKEKYGDKYNKA